MNKNQLIEKINKLNCAVEIDLFSGVTKTVYITAPVGYNFSGNHELVTAWYSGNASKLYDEAYSDLLKSINYIQKCNKNNCGSWNDGICGYWYISNERSE